MPNVATNNTELASQLQATLNSLPSATPKATQPFDMGEDTTQTTEDVNRKVENQQLYYNYTLQNYYIFKDSSKNQLIYALPIPGASKEEVSIDVTEDGKLIVNVAEKEGDASLECISSRSGCSILSDALLGKAGFDVKMPQDADIDRIEPEIKDGILRIYVPLKEIKKKRIEIK